MIASIDTLEISSSLRVQPGKTPKLIWFCLRSCLEIRIVARRCPDCGPARRDGGENKDCSGLHDAIFAPVATQQGAIRAPPRYDANFQTASKQSYVVFDDTVLDKRRSFKIELVRYQYSGNAKRVIKGIGVVTCIYVNPLINQYGLINYRIYEPDTHRSLIS
uniref:Transposase n=2 Tax=Candidatus Kentrum eta TaxID=2126337 RepID=A0A450ULD3_9GAMM|nr:MAG: hypothetical protein BECKH772B_GA0070898_1004216 [Candidatus Kentron sp. H]